MNVIYYVGLGGGDGAVSRYALLELTHNEKDIFHYSTILVNLIGSFLLVFLYLVYNEGTISEATFTFWGIGFSGAFTIFSTINNQLFESLIQREYKQALIISATTYLIIFFATLIFIFFLSYFIYE